jgi:cytochrome c oxidase subunit 2
MVKKPIGRISALGAGLLPALASASAAVTGAAEVIKSPSVGWDHLWNEVLIDITVIGIIFALITAYFVIRYRATKPVGWVVIPVFVFLADDLFVAANGWALWSNYRNVPADRLEIKLESGMYSWDYTYPNGVRTQNQLTVPAGKPIMLRMTSRDSLHSHWIPDYRVKEDSMPGRVTYLWFYPQEPGEHVVTCASYCGVMHSYMAGKVIVLPPEKFKVWLDEQAALVAADTPKPAAAGTTQGVDSAAEKKS